MKSIEIFLPLNANNGTPFPNTMFDRVENELTETFGGVTAYKRAPAQGRWKSGGQTQGDEIAIFRSSSIASTETGGSGSESSWRTGWIRRRSWSRRGTSRSCRRSIKRRYRREPR